jgi:hypothetical protein
LTKVLMAQDTGRISNKAPEPWRSMHPKLG